MELLFYNIIDDILPPLYIKPIFEFRLIYNDKRKNWVYYKILKIIVTCENISLGTQLENLDLEEINYFLM